MTSRSLLVDKEDFKWVGNDDYYFGPDKSAPAIDLVCALLIIYLGPAFIHAIVKFVRNNNYCNDKFYHHYTRIVRYGDVRIPHTSVCLQDAIVSFSWVLVNFCFINPDQFPGQFGYLIVANTTIVLLPIFRNSIVSLLIAIPFERSVKYHRWLGRGIFMLTTVHMIGYWYKWFNEGTFIEKLRVYPTMFAHASWLILLILTITSLNSVRRNWFEVFFYSHFLFIFFYIFAILHFPGMLPFAIPGFALYVIDRFLRYLRARPPNDDVKITTHGSITRIQGKRIGVLNYEPGQYCFINIPEISKLQWHPVSLSSSPNDAYFSFYVKSIGSWTKAIQSLKGQSPQIRIDGPYGAMSLDYTKYDVVMMCAGGIGVTPMFSLLRDLHYKISVRMEDVKKVYLFWTIRDPSLYYALSDAITDIMNSKISSCFNICVWITQPGNTSPLFIRGKPDWPEIFQTVRDTHTDVDRIAVLACGPDTLVNNTWDCCNRFSTKDTSFDFHKETYEL